MIKELPIYLNSCCRNKENLEYMAGSKDAESEIYECKKCETLFSVPITIIRHFEDIEEI